MKAETKHLKKNHVNGITYKSTVNENNIDTKHKHTVYICNEIQK